MNPVTAEAMERARERLVVRRGIRPHDHSSRTTDDKHDQAREELAEFASLEQIAKEMES